MFESTGSAAWGPRPDAGASEVIGSILMVALTVAVTAGFVTVLFGAVPSEDDKSRASLSGSLHKNANDWGSGDETVRVSHDGGDPLPASSLTIIVEIGGSETRYTDGGANPLDHAGEDAFSSGDTEFLIGERWRTPGTTIDPETRVAVSVIDTSASQTLWSSSFRSGPNQCAQDTQGPTVSSWSQSPSDVTTDTTGSVTVTATLTDNCGVDETVNPHLHYRINDGSNPAFTDAGAMSLQSGTTWQGTIPDQTWSNHGGKTLEYKLVGMKDDSGNTGESSIQSDLIDSCPTDTTPPTVSSWSQSPSDVTTATTGDVTVTATLSDNCAGVDTTSHPHLYYRVNDGTNPAFTDDGAMSLQSGTTWQGTIPDQTWSNHGGKTLEYKLVAMKDKKGNTGESTVQQDVIQTASSVSYVQTPLGMVIGTAANDANARSATDSGAAATLTEGSTGSTSSTSNHYGTASSGSATSPANAQGQPDDTYAVLDAASEFVQVSSYPSGSGSITKVEIALEGKHDGGADFGQPDVVRLSHSLGSTSQTYSLTTTDTQHFLDVTADRSWTWTDIQNLDVRATCECRNNPNDARVYSIDSLWVRVTTSSTTYDLETGAWTFDALGSGTTHTLEIRYKVGGSETYQVQIWDGTTWNTQSPNLDKGSYTVFSEVLTATEVTAGPQVRILGQAATSTTQDTLDLDYVRVVTS